MNNGYKIEGSNFFEDIKYKKTLTYGDPQQEQIYDGMRKNSTIEEEIEYSQAKKKDSDEKMIDKMLDYLGI